jgi:hypothetical protein
MAQPCSFDAELDPEIRGQQVFVFVQGLGGGSAVRAIGLVRSGFLNLSGGEGP